MPTPPNSDAEIARISGVMRRLRVLIGRRVISRVAIANVAPSAEISFIDVLTQIPDIGEGHGDRPAGAMVGTIAQAMRIDPSRASRLVSQMVEAGLLGRVASPDDGRISLVVRTELGQRLHQEMRDVKRRMIRAAVSDWTPDEIETFATQFERFIGQWEHQIETDHRSVPD